MKSDENKLIQDGLIEYECIECAGKVCKKNRKGLKCSCGNDNDQMFIIHSLNRLKKVSIENLLKFRKDRNGDFKPDRVDIDAVVLWLLKIYNFKTIYGTKEETIYFYKKGLWIKTGREIIKTEVERILGIWAKINVVNEVVEKIKRKTPIDFEEFDKTPINLIPLENGFYNIETNKLEEQNSEIYFKFNIPINYQVNADCPKFLKFLGETLYPDDIELMQEWFGYCLYRKYSFKKGMIFFGEKDTGKTQLLNILELMIKRENCSGLSLHKIACCDKFGLASLHNKMLNSYDDLGSKDIGDEGGFKIATGGGSLTGEMKFGDTFKFQSYSKLLFACNYIPSTKKIDDSAYFSRWFPIPFDNQVSINDQLQDFGELCFEKEKSGILNWALIGLERLLKNKRFSFNKTDQEVKAIMCRSGHPLVAFAQDECAEQDGGVISKQEFYNKYCEYMRKAKLPAMTGKMFGNNIKRHCSYLIDGWQGDKRCWRNIRVGGWQTETLK